MTTASDNERERRLDSMEQDLRGMRGEMAENQRENNRRFDQLYAAIIQNQADTNARFDRMQQENNRRFDQLFYTVIGAATALLVALIILIVRGG